MDFDIDSRIFFSADRTAMGIKTDKGIYIHLNGKRVDENAPKPQKDEKA